MPTGFLLKLSGKSMSKLKPRGGKRPNAGRKPSGKVRLQCWVNPETKTALGSKPGEAIDGIVKEKSSNLKKDVDLLNP
jgi:hypothetical protein